MTWPHSYDWICDSEYKYGANLQSEPLETISCTLGRCGDVVLPAGKTCCMDQVLKDNETCCTEDEALKRPEGVSAKEHSNGTLI